jgi:Tfp pilus assembly protein, ATPase PilM
MPQTVLGIDVGSYSVKICQVLRGFGEFKLVQFHEVPLVAEEVLSYEQAAAAALTKFFEENSVVYDTCVVSIPGHKASFRNMDMPFGNVKKIDQTMEFELETLIPFELEEVLFDYTILSATPQSSKVLTAYLREQDFKKFLEEIQAAGADPRYVGVDTVDLSNLTLLGVLPPMGRYALLDLGHTKSNFVILEGNKVKAIRCFSWGGHHLTQAIAKAAGLPYEPAESLKHTKAQLTDHPEDSINRGVKESFEDLMQQVKQTLFAFHEAGEPSLEALYLCGGTSRLQGVESFFSRRLNINVSLLDVMEDSYTELMDREKPKAILPTSLALAMRAVYPNKGARINFRRGEYAYKRDIEAIGGSLKKIGALAASVVGLGIVYFIVAYMTLSSQVDKMNKNVTKLVTSSVTGLPKSGVKSASSALTLLNSKIAELSDKLKKIQGEGDLSSLQILKTISASLPPRDQLTVDIEDLNISPDRVRMEGRTISYEGVDKVKSAMEKVKEFKNVQTGNVRKGVRDEIKFSLSFDIASSS